MTAVCESSTESIEIQFEVRFGETRLTCDASPSVGSLGDLRFCQEGGRSISNGPNAGDGSRNVYKSVFVRKFDLSGTERADLLAFCNL